MTLRTLWRRMFRQRARERELDRLAPPLRLALLRRQRAAELLAALPLRLLEFDVLAFEASRHLSDYSILLRC